MRPHNGLLDGRERKRERLDEREITTTAFLKRER